eukprot:jgi/Botrbrau1/12570/Bobra.0169s0104.1
MITKASSMHVCALESSFPGLLLRVTDQHRPTSLISLREKRVKTTFKFRRRLRSRARVLRQCEVKADSGETGINNEAFDVWIQREGVQVSKLALANFKGLRGMIATENISANETIVALPLRAVLLVTPKQRCPCPELCEPSYWSKSPWFVQMALQILAEKEKGSASLYLPYIQELPADFTSPLMWEDAELAELQYPYVLQEVKKQQERWDKAFQELIASKPGTPVTKQQLLWTMQNVRSRAFSGPYAGPAASTRSLLVVAVLVLAVASYQFLKLPLEQVLNGAIAAALFNLLFDFLLSEKVKWYAMCPIIDFCNHKGTVESNVEFDYFRNELTLKINQEYKKGEQVFISYGPQGNDSLLQFYSFVETNNPFDDYKVPDLAQRVRGALGGKPTSSDPTAPPGVFKRGGPDEATSEAIKAVLGSLAAEDVPLLRGLDPTSNAALYTAVAALCEDERKRQPSTLEQDLQSLQKPQLLSPRSLLAAQFRVEKKTVLAACASWVQKRLSKLGKAISTSDTSTAQPLSR